MGPKVHRTNPSEESLLVDIGVDTGVTVTILNRDACLPSGKAKDNPTLETLVFHHRRN